MVLPGTFMPFFFPLGIAFMGAQSAVMMKMAGEQWQYGKRRISAMSNEDFNKMTPLKLYQIETNELRAIIPNIQKSLEDMRPLTQTIVLEMVNLVEDFIKTAPIAVLKALGIDVEGIITGKTPGELEYEKWLEGGGKGKPPAVEDIFPEVKPPKPEKKPDKTKQQIDDEFKKTQAEIDKQAHSKKMSEYTTFLNKLVTHNQRILYNKNRIKNASNNKKGQAIIKAAMKKIAQEEALRKQTALHFSNWKKNNRAWLHENNLL